jgi:phage shock protein C
MSAMKSRDRTYTPQGRLREEGSFDLDHYTDEEIEALLFEEKENVKTPGFWNLPTIAGLSMILVGVVYLFQILGIWQGFDLGNAVRMLPWLAGILIIITGLGVLSWRPQRKARIQRKVTRPDPASARTTTIGSERVVVEQKKGRKKLTKSTNKKLAGVCGGIAEYMSIDPTLVRVAFLIGLFASSGGFVLAYLLLAYIMPQGDRQLEERITIIRDTD